MARPWPRLASCEIWFAHGAGTPDARHNPEAYGAIEQQLGAWGIGDPG